MSRANPIKSTVSPVPRLPAHVIVYKVEASQYWWVRFYSTRKRYVIRSSKSTDKRVAFALARDLFVQDLADPKGNLPLTPKTFAAVAESLLKRQEATEKPSLWKKERNQLHNFVYKFLGDKILGEINHQDLNEFAVEMRNRSLAPQTKKHYVNVIRKVFKHGIEIKVIDQLPLFPKIGDKLITQKKRDYFNRDEYNTLSRTINRLAAEGAEYRGTPITVEFKLLGNFMINSFIRPSDLRVLKHKHIDRRNDTDAKTNKESNWLTLRHPATKTTALDVQTMPAAVGYYDDLVAFRKQQFQIGATPSAFLDPDDYVFLPSYKNRETAIGVIGRVFSHVIDKSGLAKQTGKHFTLYSLRHTAIMYRLINSEVDSIALAKNARTSQAVIEKFYGAHLTTEQARVKIHSFIEGIDPFVRDDSKKK